MCGFRQSHRLFTSTQSASMVLPSLDTLGKQNVSRAGKQSSASLLLYTSKLPSNLKRLTLHSYFYALGATGVQSYVLVEIKIITSSDVLFIFFLARLEPQHNRHPPHFRQCMSYIGRGD